MANKTIEADWEGIRLAVCNGMTFKEAEKVFRVGWETIRKRAQRQKWPTLKAVKDKATETIRAIEAKERAKQGVPFVPEVDLTAILAQNWVEKGEIHRALAFKMAHEAIKGASQRAQKVHDWQDLERADKMARRAAGLDGNEGSASVNVSLNLVNQRLKSINLPPDAQESPSLLALPATE